MFQQIPVVQSLPPGIIESKSNFICKGYGVNPVSFRRISKYCFFIIMARQVNGMNLSGHGGRFMSVCYAKRFMHPDIVATYDYIFIWNEDLGVEHFNGEKFIQLVKKHGLEISQPGLEPNNGLTWQMTKRRGDREVNNHMTLDKE